jgi:hypothetical protein
MKKILFIIIALTIVATTFAQDGKQTFTRKILIEQFTGADCGWCPSGAERIATAISGNSNVVWIKYHAGFGTDFLTNDIATAMTRFYGGNTFAPAVMFDRTHFSAANPAPVMSVGQISDIRQYLAQAKGVATTCKVYTPSLSYNPATRHLSGTVSGRFGDNSFGDSTRLIVFIIEDSLVGRQADYNNGTQNAFVHMGTVRAAITDMWGDPIAVDVDNNNSFSYTVDYTLPADYVYKNCCVVVLVYHYDPSDVNNCPVLNAAQSDYFDRTLGIAEVSESCSVRLFPNPAHDMVAVELSSQHSAAPCQIALIDASGRQLAQHSFAGSTVYQFSVASLPAGIYLLRVTTPDGVATRQLLKR